MDAKLYYLMVNDLYAKDFDPMDHMFTIEGWTAVSSAVSRDTIKDIARVRRIHHYRIVSLDVTKGE